MKAFISLAISMLLIGLLYVYVRQQFALLENHVDELKRVIKMLALPEQVKPDVKPDVKVVELQKEVRPELITVSDDESDETDESDNESDESVEMELQEMKGEPNEMRAEVSHVMLQGHDLMQLMQHMSFPTYADPEPALEIEEIEAEPKSIVMDDKGYENMSVKELKEKVQLQGGPSLKTKKQLVEYLEKNVSK